MRQTPYNPQRHQLNPPDLPGSRLPQRTDHGVGVRLWVLEYIVPSIGYRVHSVGRSVRDPVRLSGQGFQEGGANPYS